MPASTSTPIDPGSTSPAIDPAYRAGILSRPAYDAAVSSPLFARMEIFSAAFLVYDLGIASGVYRRR